MRLFIIQEASESVLWLGEKESYHLSKVLRIKQGEEVYATDARGNLWKALVNTVSKKQVSLLPVSLERGYKKHPYFLEVGISPLKAADRFEWFLEKATEIGVDVITPILCERSEQKRLNFSRANKILHSAIKQSFKPYLPVLNQPTSFREFLARKNTKNLFIAHCDPSFKRVPFKKYIKESSLLDLEFTLLIGPEGDFSSEEIKQAIALNCKSVSLSNSRLRSETAAIAGIHTVNLLLG